MKRILSVVLVLVMVCSFMVMSTSAAAPTGPIIAVSGNESDPAKGDTDVSLKLHLNQFSTVSAAQINITFAAGVEFVSIEGDKNVTLTQGKNFVYDAAERALTIVDVFDIAKSEITLVVKATATTVNNYEITVNGLAIGSDETTVDVDTFSGVLAIGAKITDGHSADGTNPITIGNATTHFVPYGGVYYTADGTFVDKAANGSFTPATAGDVTVDYFKLPAEGKKLTTFGSSSRTDSGKKSLQFGTHVAERVADAEYGTMLIVSEDYEAYMSHYNALGYSDNDVIKAIMAAYQKRNENEATPSHVYLTVGGTDLKITVYNSEQTKFMWGDGTANSFQYALRATNVSAGNDYVAVGYQLENGVYTFSTEIKVVSL